MSDVATVFLSGRMHSSPGDCSHRLIVMNESTDAAVQASKPRVAGVTLNRLPREELVLRWLAWWRNGSASDLRSRGRGIHSPAVRARCLTTPGKLFTPMFLDDILNRYSGVVG